MDVYDIIRDAEGLRLEVYDDATGKPVNVGDTCRGNLTIGYGHTSPGLTPGMVIDKPQAEKFLIQDVLIASAAASRIISELDWLPIDLVRQAAIIDMVFTLGQGGFAKFSHTIWSIRFHDWDASSANVLASEWATKQAVRRARRDANMLKTGEWPTISL